MTLTYRIETTFGETSSLSSLIGRGAQKKIVVLRNNETGFVETNYTADMLSYVIRGIEYAQKKLTGDDAVIALEHADNFEPKATYKILSQRITPV